MGIVAGGPYNSGILAGGTTYNYADAPADVVARARALDAVCQSHSVNLPAAALQFIHERIAGSKLLLLDAAHLTNVEQDRAFTHAVLEFIPSPSR